MGVNPQSDFDATQRLELVVKECCEALDHLRKAVDHADGRDPCALKLVAVMKRVAGIADDVIAARENGGNPPPSAQKPAKRSA